MTCFSDSIWGSPSGVCTWTSLAAPGLSWGCRDLGLPQPRGCPEPGPLPLPTSQNMELAASAQSARDALSELDSLREKASRVERLEMEAKGLRQNQKDADFYAARMKVSPARAGSQRHLCPGRGERGRDASPAGPLPAPQPICRTPGLPLLVEGTGLGMWLKGLFLLGLFLLLLHATVMTF